MITDNDLNDVDSIPHTNSNNNFDEKISKLENQMYSINELRNQISSLNSGLSDLQALPGRVAELEKISSKSNNPPSIDYSAIISKLESLCNQQSQEINSLRTSITEMESKITQLEGSRTQTKPSVQSSKSITQPLTKPKPVSHGPTTIKTGSSTATQKRPSRQAGVLKTPNSTAQLLLNNHVYDIIYDNPCLVSESTVAYSTNQFLNSSRLPLSEFGYTSYENYSSDEEIYRMWAYFSDRGGTDMMSKSCRVHWPKQDTFEYSNNFNRKSKTRSLSSVPQASKNYRPHSLSLPSSISYNAPSSLAKPSGLFKVKSRDKLHPLAWKPGGLAVKSSITSRATSTNGFSRPKSNSGTISVKSSLHSILKGSPTHSRDDGIVRTFLRGRPIAHHLPSSIKDTYDLSARLEAPQDKLQLEWVYGYRGKDCRDNVLVLQTGEICYFIASVVILYNIETHNQRHYLGHNDDIKAIALHPDKITLATGQVAGHDKKEGKAHVRIWNSISLETLQIIGLGTFERAVCSLSFSKVNGGIYLAAVDEANDHFLSIWEWSKMKKITETKSSADPVVGMNWSSTEANSLVTCGKNHLNFWNFENSTLSKKQGIYEKYEKPKVAICLAYLENGDLITGDSTGNIYIWQTDTQRITHACIGAHDGGIFSITVRSNGNIVTGGGKDRKIIEWNANLEKLSDGLEIPEWFGACRMITLSQNSDSVYIGTTKNCLLHSKSVIGGESFSVLVQGQFDEFWALATHPCTHQFLSAGQDSQVILWDALTRRTIWSTKVQFQISCADFYPLITQGSVDPVVALGATNGKWMVMNLSRHEVIAVHSDGAGEQVQCISYSPDGKYLAVGTRDNFTYIYQVSDSGQRYNRLGKCAGHSSVVLHLDWSMDSTTIRTMSADYEVLYWNPIDCKQITGSKKSDIWDLKWMTHTVSLGWDVIGIWPEDADGTDINACAWTHSDDDKRVLVTGDDFGFINLFSYPSCQLFAKANSYGGHSSHVTEVRFLFDDSRLISAGGKDSAVMQWSLIPTT